MDGVCGQGSSRKAVPLHDLVDVLDPITVDGLPVAHVDDYSNLLTNFAKQPLSKVMISKAEIFLVFFRGGGGGGRGGEGN